MKISPAAMIFVIFLGLCATAQTLPNGAAAPVQASQAASPDTKELNSILADLQQWMLLASRDLTGLRIEKWKTDNAQKMEMEKAVASLQRNLATIVPGPVNDLRKAPDSASKSFKLYHNVNLVYEFLGSVTDAAGSFGREDEYDPLAGDVASLDKLRHRLSQHAEQAAALLETNLQEARTQEAKLEALVEAAAQASAPRKVVIEDPAPAKKPKKPANKKISSAAAPAPAR